ncbi:YkyA family protein [Bacillus sp. BRMEA1]|nr:YkyA family protein [Neobacillus endophyticus]
MVLILFLTGCGNKQKPIDNLYTALEQVAVKEKVFEEQQKPITELEKKEKSLYDQIIKLGVKDYSQIVILSDEAIASADKREMYLEKETNSIKESEKEFQKLPEINKGLEDPSIRQLSEELYHIMIQRYNAHDELVKEYTLAIQYDKQLYGMFKNKNLPLNQLEVQVNKINEEYKKVSAANETFNKLTEQYNAKKVELYKKAGLDTK